MGLKDQKTEDRILEAAKTVFMKYGLYGARMQEIADTAGINKALLHYYFRNKEKMFDQVFENALSRYFQQMNIFADETLPLLDRIYIYVDSLIDFLSEYPQMSMFIIKEISVNPTLFKEKVNSLKKDKNSNLLTLLSAGMQRKEIPEIDPVLFMMSLHSLCSYPFLASPIFKTIIEKSNSKFDDPANLKLKQAVKEFVAFKISFNSTLNSTSKK